MSDSNTRPKVSVIIAVYGAERWIDRCARSLFEQTLSDIEYIFIDDCSPDRSIDVMQHTLADYPDRRRQVRVIRHERNQGVAAARTTGMKAATGEYMIHCDPDDWVEPQTYRLMYDKAKATDADIVTCGCKIYYKNNISYERYNCEGRGIEIIKSGKAIHALWLIMVKSSIVIDHGIYPFEGINWGEDSACVYRFYYFAKKVAYITDICYHYDQSSNISSITKGSYDYHLINNWATLLERIIEWFQSQDIDITPYIARYIINLKINLLSLGDIDISRKIFPEYNDKIKEHPSLTLVQRLLLPSAFKHNFAAKLYLAYKRLRGMF